MKSYFRKFIAGVCLCTGITVGLSDMTVSAATLKNRTINNSKEFKKAWEKTVTHRLKSTNTKIAISLIMPTFVLRFSQMSASLKFGE